MLHDDVEGGGIGAVELPEAPKASDRGGDLYSLLERLRCSSAS